MRKLDPEMKCSLPPAKQKKKKRFVYLSLNTCIPKEYSWSVQMIECELIKPKCKFARKKKDEHCYKLKNLLAQAVLWID